MNNETENTAPATEAAAPAQAQQPVWVLKMLRQRKSAILCLFQQNDKKLFTGNYGESFERNLGPKTPLALPRGINNQWTNGGILYAPPVR